MERRLMKLKDFWNSVPSELDDQKYFTGFDRDMSMVLNGRSDVSETDEMYDVKIEVPGVKKDEVSITLKNDVLTVSWNRKNEKKGNAKVKRYEMSEGSFRRSFRVEGADPERINAKLNDGILSIEVPKKENVKPKSIIIK